MTLPESHRPEPTNAILTLSQAASDALLKHEAQIDAGPCEHCGRRPKYWDRGKGACRLWCAVCIEGYGRKPENANDHVGIPERYHRANLSDLPEPIVAAYRALPDDRGLMLWGPPGTGKTHTMCALARDLYLSGWATKRITYEMLMLRIRDTYKPGSQQTELGVIMPLVDVGKLIVEDVGTTVSPGGQESDFSLRTVLLLLDQRLEACRATFFTTNKPVEELQRSFDGRVASRIIQACEILRLTGPDRRKKEPKKEEGTEKGMEKQLNPSLRLRNGFPTVI